MDYDSEKTNKHLLQVFLVSAIANIVLIVLVVVLISSVRDNHSILNEVKEYL